MGNKTKARKAGKAGDKMSITKRGEIATNLVVVSFSYICNKCGNILTVEETLEKNDKCGKCSEGIMILSHAESDIKK